MNSPPLDRIRETPLLDEIRKEAVLSPSSRRADNADVNQQIYDIIASRLKTKVGPGMRLREDLGMDSLDFVEAAMDFENRFRTTVPDNVLDKWKTVDDIVDSIRGNQRK